MTERDKEKLWAFYEWKQTCAYDKCSTENKEVLGTYGRWRFNECLKKLSHQVCGVEPLEQSEKEYAWALIEQHALNTTYVKKQELLGKRYKDGIFYKVNKSDDPPLKIIQGDLKAMFRDVVRKQSLKKYDAASLDENRGVDGGYTLHDLLPDQSIDPTFLDELNEIALSEVPDVFQRLEFRERVLILSKHEAINKPASDPLVLKVAETAKSTMGDVNTRIYTEQRHLTYLADKYESEDQETISILTQMIQGHLKTAVFYWAQSEMRCQPLLESSVDNDIHFGRES